MRLSICTRAKLELQYAAAVLPKSMGPGLSCLGAECTACQIGQTLIRGGNQSTSLERDLLCC